jgi:hypothetical protein
VIIPSFKKRKMLITRPNRSTNQNWNWAKTATHKLTSNRKTYTAQKHIQTGSIGRKHNCDVPS